MNMRAAKIDNGVVTKVLIVSELIEGMVASDTANIGDAYANGIFTRPPDPDPVIIPPISISPLEFIERFTDGEQLAVVTAAMTSPPLRLWYDKLMAARDIVFDDARLIEGMNALVTAGLITQVRRNAILG